MPIKPENKHLYPDDWPQIRQAILERASFRCEQCGLPNHAIVTRPDRRVVSGREAKAAGIFEPTKITKADQSILHRLHWVRIVLTIAHLDHNPENNSDDNLQALCQRCHNRYDREHRRETREATKQKTTKKFPGWQLRLGLEEGGNNATTD